MLRKLFFQSRFIRGTELSGFEQTNCIRNCGGTEVGHQIAGIDLIAQNALFRARKIGVYVVFRNPSAHVEKRRDKQQKTDKNDQHRRDFDRLDPLREQGSEKSDGNQCKHHGNEQAQHSQIEPLHIQDHFRKRRSNQHERCDCKQRIGKFAKQNGCTV